MEDDPKAGDDATKEIQDNPNDVMETAGDPVKKDKQPYDWAVRYHLPHDRADNFHLQLYWADR